MHIWRQDEMAALGLFLFFLFFIESRNTNCRVTAQSWRIHRAEHMPVMMFKRVRQTMAANVCIRLFVISVTGYQLFIHCCSQSCGNNLTHLIWWPTQPRLWVAHLWPNHFADGRCGAHQFAPLNGLSQRCAAPNSCHSISHHFADANWFIRLNVFRAHEFIRFVRQKQCSAISCSMQSTHSLDTRKYAARTRATIHHSQYVMIASFSIDNAVHSSIFSTLPFSAHCSFQSYTQKRAVTVRPLSSLRSLSVFNSPVVQCHRSSHSSPNARSHRPFEWLICDDGWTKHVCAWWVDGVHASSPSTTTTMTTATPRD